MSNSYGDTLQAKNVTPAVTKPFSLCGIVPTMVTKRLGPRPFYLKEWRKFMGTKPLEIAIALDIERQSYHRLEKNWHTINQGELQIIADTIGVEPSQFWFPPPEIGQQEKISIDDLLEDVPDDVQALAINAIRGMIGK